MTGKPNLITLTTDFGDSQGHVGTMKGVMVSINPGVRFIDISHDVPSHDIHHGAFVIGMACRFFPRGTVHVGVVDPGVGSTRRSIALRTDRHTFVGPDNGLFTMVYSTGESEAWEITETKYTLGPPFTTFDGRDVYAPVASYLSLGVPIEEMGKRLDDPVLLPLSEPVYGERELRGEVVHVDQFGNLVTNIEMGRFLERFSSSDVNVKACGRKVRGPVGSYSEGGPGEAVCLWGSHGLLEVAAYGSRAVDLLPGAKRGSAVTIRAR